MKTVEMSLLSVASDSEVNQTHGVRYPRVAVRTDLCVHFRDKLLGVLGAELTLGIEYVAFAVGYHGIAEVGIRSDKKRYVEFYSRL